MTNVHEVAMKKLVEKVDFQNEKIQKLSSDNEKLHEKIEKLALENEERR